MGKVKSAIITTILSIVLVVGIVFATVSFGGNSIHPLNSILSMIPMGAEFTGSAENTMYPKGVLTSTKYQQKYAADSEIKEDYTLINGYYFENDTFEIDNKTDTEELWNDTVKKVAHDTDVMNRRLSARNLTSYTIAIVDEIGIHMSIPTTYTYARYKAGNSQDFENDTASSDLAYIFYYTTLSGDLDLRHEAIGYKYYDYSIIPKGTDAGDIFKGVERVARAGNYAFKYKLTDLGKELLEEKTTELVDAENTDNIELYIGDIQVSGIPTSSVIDGDFYVTLSDGTDATIRTLVCLIDSVVQGDIVSQEYEFENSALSYTTSEYGVNTALFTAIALGIGLIAVIVLLIVKYRKLGVVASLNILLYCLVLIYVCYFTSTVITFAAIATAIIGLGVFVGCMVYTFENVRAESAKGKTMPAAVKSGYRNVLFTMIDLHVVLLVAAILLTYVCVGSISACGVVLFTSTLNSYVLLWFTRYLWYVMSTPEKDKFKFCNFKRVVYEDD